MVPCVSKTELKEVSGHEHGQHQAKVGQIQLAAHQPRGQLLIPHQSAQERLGSMRRTTALSESDDPLSRPAVAVARCPKRQRLAQRGELRAHYDRLPYRVQPLSKIRTKGRSVLMRTPIWMIMCTGPVMFKHLNGWIPPNTNPTSLTLEPAMTLGGVLCPECRHHGVDILHHNSTVAHETTRHALMMMRVVLDHHGGQL